MSDIPLFPLEPLYPWFGACLGLLAGFIAWRVTLALAKARELAVPPLGPLWILAAGGFGAAALWRFGVEPHGAALVVFGAIACSTIAFDFAHRRIPNEWSLAIGLLGIADVAAGGRLVEGAATGAGGAALLWGFGALYGLVRGRAGLGLGDVKLVAGLGIWLGPVGLIWCFLAASIVTALAGAAALLLRRLADDPPFGPGLLAGAMLLLILGPPGAKPIEVLSESAILPAMTAFFLG